MVFNVTFNNISVKEWRSVLLVEETRENHWPATSHWQTLSHNVVSSTPRNERDLKLTTLVMIGTDCTDSCIFNYHTITTSMAPNKESVIKIQTCKVYITIISPPICIYLSYEDNRRKRVHVIKFIYIFLIFFLHSRILLSWSSWDCWKKLSYPKFN